ncbi:MAG: RluA family pseudouridine synthase [Eubacterium sp.]|nr:RluA family pseudouridine synthase [Eubacterium sp.]
MKRIEVKSNDANQRLDKFLLKTFESLPKSLMFKQIRKKNIKVNKKRCYPEQEIKEDDIIELYLPDDVLKEKEKHYDFLKAPKELNIIYEDKNIIILNKKSGVLCHPMKGEYVNTLTSSLKRYLYENGEWNPENENSFSPAIANRIDRNTSGIVLGAKNFEALKFLGDKIKNRKIKKFYLTICEGKFDKTSDLLEGYLTKNEQKNIVSVSENETQGAKKILTKYNVLDYSNGYSLVEVELLTGRTHQIRAHLASIGHPLMNDGKYGKKHGRFSQELCSYKVRFDFNEEGSFSYLSGKEFEIKDCEILRKFEETKLEK